MAIPVHDSEPAAHTDTSAPLRVSLGDRSYDIYIGPGLLARAGRLIPQAAGPGTAFLISHPKIARLHGDALHRGLGPLASHTILVPSGERRKSLRRAAALWHDLQARGADRRSIIIAFGGGVIGDLAGFVAATYMRGLPYVQIPTTLLAQVDSSVGGKVAVNHPRAKNLIGAFHQPRLVLADPGPLSTLPAREYRAGLAEVVKHAVIADPDLFTWLEDNLRPASRRDPAAVSHMVRCSCRIKADVVRRDERDEGLRAALNFGHTTAHALESLTSYHTLRHGEAVAIGMVAAARIARLLDLFPPEDEARLQRLLAAFHLPTRIPGAPAPDILAAMQSDKKTLAGVPRFVLPRAIGRVDIGCEVPPAVLARALAQTGAQT